MKLVVKCGWHSSDKVLEVKEIPGPKNKTLVSHGMCKECYEKQMKKVKSKDWA